MRLVSLIALLVSCSLVVAAPPIVVEVPRGDPATWQELKVARGRILRLSATPKSEWTLVDDSKADLLPVDDGKFGDFAAAEDGRYKLLVTSPGGPPTRVIVVVGTGFGPLPGPGPGPTPAVDPLADRLKAAYEADPEKILNKRQSHAKDLASVYRLVAKAAGDPTFATAGDFITFARKSAAEMVDADAPKGTRCLSGVRDEVSKELLAIFPADGPLTADQRSRSAALFIHLATILETF